MSGQPYHPSDTLSSQNASLPPVTTRRYEQRQRAEDAEKTRQRIVDAVLERLRAAPAEPVAIEKIAAMAGVARSTVYAIFGSRAGLFDAVGAHLQERTGYERLVEASHRPDARAAFRGGLRAASEMLAAERDTWRALRSMAQLDQEAVGGSVQRWEDERAAAMARIAARLHEQGHLRPEVTAEEANDVLWVITSFESFDLLYSGRGLPLDVVVERLTDAAERALMRRA
jgi:AcrR family transcriptional regulator